jgi:hypothetical protein
VAGLGTTKQAILTAGGNWDMLASGMMETEKLDATTYPLGDNKTGDSFNAGICKQNWGMIRSCHPAYKNLTSSDYLTSTAMNTDRVLDATVYKECRAMWPGNLWLAGHRDGSAGIANPNTPDIQWFIQAYNWTHDMLACHQNDDVRFWVNVVAIIVD